MDALKSVDPESTFYVSGFNPIIYNHCNHPVETIVPEVVPSTLRVHAGRHEEGRCDSLIRPSTSELQGIPGAPNRFLFRHVAQEEP
jgi:hypothetical protein